MTIYFHGFVVSTHTHTHICVCVYIYIQGYTYAQQVYIYTGTGVHCYTSASWRQLKGYWPGIWGFTVTLWKPCFPNLFPSLLGKCTAAAPRDSCCYSILEALCFPITTYGSDTIWQILVCRNLDSWHPTQWWEGSKLDHKKLKYFILLLYTSKSRHLTLSVFLFSTVVKLWVKAYLY